jgi:hypothetical protein
MAFWLKNIVVLLMVFVSGFAVMSVEMLGGRILAPYFGSSVYVWGSLIFTFMVGLSLGYGLGGMLSERYFSVRALAVLLVLSALQIWILTGAADWVLTQTFEATDDPRTGSLIAAMILYLTPTATMGMMSPLAIRAISHNLHQVGSYAGMLYLVSTMGSAVGTLLTAFWLVSVYEVATIMYLNVGLLLAAALMGYTKDALKQKN